MQSHSEKGTVLVKNGIIHHLNTRQSPCLILGTRRVIKKLRKMAGLGRAPSQYSIHPQK